jgi:phenylacetate-CoA ligase
MGSLNDQAILPSGKKVPGISFYFVAQELLESSFKVKEFLFRQKDGVFIFEYVADEDLTDAEFLKLKKGLIGTLGQGLQLQTKRVSALQRGASGKFKHFISTKD